MSTSPSSGPRGTSACQGAYPEVSALIPRQRSASESHCANRPPATPDPSPRRRWPPWLAAGSVMLGTACVGITAVAFSGPVDTSEYALGEMTPPRALAPALIASPSAAPPTPTEVAPAQQPGGPIPVPPLLVRVRYELDGAPYAGLVSFTSGQASPVTEVTQVRLPWRKEFDAAGGFVPSVSVQSAGSGSISCRIIVDGELVSSVTTQGTNAVATCTAQALSDEGQAR